MGRRKRGSGLENLIFAAIIFLLLLLFRYPEKTFSVLLATFGIVLICCGLVFIFKSRSNSNQAQQPTQSGYSPVQHNAPARAVKLVWTIELMRELDWKVFEQLCADYFLARGYQAKVTNTGADGGIDVDVYGKDDPDTMIGIAQCKAWKKPVGVREVRELLGVMANANYKFGIYFTTSTYTEEAMKFANNNNIQLMDAVQLLHEIEQLPLEIQKEMLALATVGDYTTPSCPKCDSKLVLRTARSGTGKKFWACPQFPRCRYTMPMRKL